MEKETKMTKGIFARQADLQDDFDNRYDTDYDLQDEHGVYIMENCHGDRIIGNGDMLIEAQEAGYLYEEFREFKLGF